MFPSSSAELFPVPSWEATSHGDPPPGHAGKPRSQGHSCVVAGKTGSTRGRIGTRGEGAAAPLPQTPSMQPLSLPSPPHGARTLPDEEVAQEELGHGGKLRDPRALSMGLLTATGNAVPKPELLPVPFPVPRCRTSHGCYSLTTSPSWQPTAAPSLGGAVSRGRGGTDPIPGHVPAALCDLQAWRRWVPLHPPHPAGHLGASPLSWRPLSRFPGAFAGTDAPRFPKSSGHPDSSLALPSPGRARGASLPLSVPQFPRGAGGRHCCQRSPAEARTHDPVGHW